MGCDEFISGTVSIPSKLIIISNIAMEVAISHAQTRIYLRHRRWDTRLHKTCPWIQEGPLNANTVHTTSSLARASAARTDLCVLPFSTIIIFINMKNDAKARRNERKNKYLFPWADRNLWTHLLLLCLQPLRWCACFSYGANGKSVHPHKRRTSMHLIRSKPR